MHPILIHGILPNGGKGRQRGMTMNIEFKCPQCGKPVSADESYRGKVIECPYCTKGIVVPKNKMNSVVQRQVISNKPTMQRQEVAHQYVCCEGMIFDCSSPSSGSSSTTESVNTPESAETYICTHCGESTTSLRKLHGGIGGCLTILLIVPLCLFALWIGMFPPIICIGGALLFLICGIIGLCQGERTMCTKCGKFNTMIPGTSPQGRRLLKEMNQDGKTTNQPPPTSPSLSPEPRPQDVSERLNKIRKLLDNGLISAEEYEAQRKRILESI